MATEAETIAGLRAGDPDTFRAAVAELNPGLARLARMYVPAAIADEVVQDTWSAVIRSIDGFEGRSSLKTWIFRILLNKVRTVATRESKIVPFAAMGSGGGDPAVDADMFDRPDRPGHWRRPPPRWDTLPEERLESAETLAAIERAIDQLPPAQREVVSLRDVQGWTSEEVCNALGISSVNQRVLLHRGRAALRATLEEFLTDD